MCVEVVQYVVLISLKGDEVAGRSMTTVETSLGFETFCKHNKARIKFVNNYNVPNSC